MNKRTLTLLISAALLGAAGSAVAQTDDTYERGAPPPVSETPVPPIDPTFADEDERDDGFVTGDDPLDSDTPQVRTQSPPNDPTLASRLDADADADVRTEGNVVIDEYGEDRALADAEYDAAELDADAELDTVDDVAASSAVDQDPVDYAEQPLAGNDLDDRGEADAIDDTEGTPFAETAGSEGFSEGRSAELAEQRFGELDSDGDGELDKDELDSDSELAGRQQEYDINGDGMIAQNEFQSWFAAQNSLEGDADSRDGELATTDQDAIDDVDVDAEGDDDQPRELATIEQDEFVDETEADLDTDADFDTDADLDPEVDVDVDVDGDLDND